MQHNYFLTATALLLLSTACVTKDPVETASPTPTLTETTAVTEAGEKAKAPGVEVSRKAESAIPLDAHLLDIEVTNSEIRILQDQLDARPYEITITNKSQKTIVASVRGAGVSIEYIIPAGRMNGEIATFSPGNYALSVRDEGATSARLARTLTFEQRTAE
jgi:hypothetical protein